MDEPFEPDDAGRATFAALADVLIPAAGSMPAPSAIGIEGRWLDRALGARPDLGAALGQVLDDAA